MNVIRFSTESASGEAATVKSRKGKKNQDAHRRIVFLTYSQCTISSKDEFEARFSDMLQHIGYPDATYYGCREHHKTEGIHYHVLVNLRKQPNWSMKHARRAFQVKGNDCKSLNISLPRTGQTTSQFEVNHVNYCEKEKGGDVFGQRPKSAIEKQTERMRKWQEIGSQTTAEQKFALMKLHYPDA